MISFVKGELVSIYDDYVVIECNNMGFNIFVPGSVIEKIGSIGSEIKLYTYLNVREDAMQLYGFLNEDQLYVFKLLITVNGVGPKGALGILTVLDTNDLRFAIAADDSKAISKAPGIGAKTAQKVILELKDKLKLEDAISNTLDGGSDMLISSTVNVSSDIKNEAVMALVSLGYSQSDSLKAVKSVKIDETMTTEDIIKLALRAMI